MYINFVGGSLDGSIHLKRNNEFTEYIPVAEKGHPLLFTPRIGDSAFAQSEELGYFQFGSNVVLLFEAPRDLTISVKPGDQLKYGQVIGHLAPAN